MFEKIKNTFLKYKPYIILTTITTLLFLSGFYNPLWIVASVFVGLFYITCSLNEMFCYTLYFTMFSTIGLFYVVSLIIAFVFIIIKYIVALVQKKEKFFAMPFVLTTIFVIVFSLICYEADYYGFQQAVLVIAILYVIYFSFVYRKQIDVRKCFRFLLVGLIVSIALSAVSLIFDNYAYQIYYDDGIFDGAYKRLRLLTYHQNQLAIFCMFLVAYSIFSLINKNTKWYYELFIIALCFVVGLCTMSKTFLVLMVGFFVYYCLYLILKFKWKSLKIILPIIFVLAIAGFIFNDFVVKLYNRFFIYMSSGSLISKITTGRSAIWATYLHEITSSIPKLLFGHGLFNIELIEIGPHNVLIYFAYRTGAVGLILLGIIAYSYYRASHYRVMPTYKNMLAFLTFVIISFIEMIFSDRFFIFFVLGLLLMVPKKTDNKLDSVNEKN